MRELTTPAFVQNWRGPKLRLVATGMGATLGGLFAIPGSSNLIDSLFIPYSKDSLERFIRKAEVPGYDAVFGENAASSVSKEMVVAMHAANCCEASNAVAPVTITAAITTSRYRKGNNHAFIAVGLANPVVYHLLLDKLQEHEHVEPAIIPKRHIQDTLISLVALHLATGIPSSVLDELQAVGALTEV